jgi:tetratricopeptide (TPR) repeat protein
MHSIGRSSLWIKIAALAVVLIALNVHPASFAVQSAMQAARIAQANGFHQEAADHYRQVLAREPWRIWLWEQVGFEEAKAGRLPQAVEAFSRANAAGSLSLQGRFQLGEALMQQNEMDAAEVTWKMLLQDKTAIPEDLAAKTYERLASLQRSRGDFSRAVETLRAWLAADPSNVQAIFLLGLNLTPLNPDEALPLLIEASTRDTVYTPTVQILRRGINAASAGEDPGYRWVMIGRALGSAGQWDLASKAFEQAVMISPQYAEAWAFLGEARYQLGKPGKVDLDRAVELNPKSVVARALLALYYRQEGNYDLALENLQTAARQEPEEPIWEVEMGNICAEKGDLPVALEHFQKATSLAPDISIYWQYLARFSVSYDTNVQTIGLPAARQAVILAPNDPGALDVMGWTMVYLEDYASAERFLRQAVERNTSYALAYLHLGQLCLQQNDLEHAHPYLDRAMSLDGDGSIGLVAERLLRQYY